MILEAKNVQFAYGSRMILQDINFSAEEGQLVALLGRNGAGKSTLFRLMLNLRKPARGHILLDGKNISQMGARELAEKIAYIPQAQPGAFRFLVKDVILMGTSPSFGTLALPKAEHVERACAAMQELGISEFADRSYDELSGGEQQLVLIARSLAQKAPCLVMDEPTASLDFGNQVKVMEIAKRLAQSGYLIFLSTHNPQHVLHYADRVLLLDDGKLVGDGKPRDVLSESVLSKIYDVPVSVSENDHGQLAVLPALEGPLRKNPWRLYEDLVEPVGDEIVEKVYWGDIWTAVETKNGFGLAMRQTWPEPIEALSQYEGMSLKDVAKDVFSFNLARASLGLAAINCWFNRPERLRDLGWQHEPGMYALDGLDLTAKTVGMVGHLRHANDYFQEAKALYIFDREPRPGDLPDTAEEMMLPTVDVCMVTGSTLSNKSLPRVLELLRQATTVLAGPSVPMSDVLFSYGIERIAGLVVLDREATKQFIVSGVKGPPFQFGAGFMADADDRNNKFRVSIH